MQLNDDDDVDHIWLMHTVNITNSLDFSPRADMPVTTYFQTEIWQYSLDLLKWNFAHFWTTAATAWPVLLINQSIKHICWGASYQWSLAPYS